MRFSNLPVTDLTDVTHDFEQLQGLPILASTFGTATLTFGGGTTASATVAHGIGRTPRVWTQFNGSPGVQLTLGVDTATTTQFTIHGLGSAAIAGSVSVFWLAIG